MGIDLNKLAEIVKVADAAGNANGNLEITNAKELSVFNQELEKLQLSKEEKNSVYQMMGLQTATTPQQKTVARSLKAQKQADARQMAHTLRQVTNLVASGVTGENLMAELDKRLDGTYQDLKNEVAYLLDLVPAYNSKKDVEKIEKTVKKQLDKKDPNYEFQKDVLEQLVAQAEATQYKKEWNEVVKAFEAKYDPKKNTLESVYEEIRDEYKDKGSYYNDFLTVKNKWGHKLINDGKQWNEFEQNYLMPKARKIASEAVYESDATKSKAVKKDAKGDLKADGTYDKYTKHALNGENTTAQKLSGHDSDMKIKRKNQARENKVEDAKVQTEEEILKALDGGLFKQGGVFKKDREYLLEALVQSGLVSDNGDGTYDLSVLSDIIRKELGGNYKLDRHASIDKAIAEKTRVTGALSVATMLEDMDENDAQALVKLCGFEKEGKNWAKALLKTTVGALVGGAGSGFAEATRGKVVIDKTWTFNYHTELNFQGSNFNASDILGMTKEEMEAAGMTTNATATMLQIIIDKQRVIDFFYKSGTHIMPAAIKGALFGAAAGLLDGLKDTGEIPITPTSFECTTIEEYIARVKKETPEYADFLATLATAFQDEKTGKWDCEGYKALLNNFAGNGGKLNREEQIALHKWLQNQEKELTKVDKGTPSKPSQPAKVDEPKQEVKQIECKEDKCPLDYDETAGAKSLQHTVKYRDSWEGLVEAYFPNWKDCFGKMYGKGGAIQALKREVAKNDAEYKKLLQGYIPSVINIPHKLGDCVRNDNGKVDSKYANTSERPVGTMGEVGKKYSEDGKVTLTDCNGNSATAASEKDALAKLNEMTGKKYTKDDIIK